MGTAPKPKSTRARKARSVKSAPITALKGMFTTAEPDKVPVSVSYLRELHKRIDIATGAAAICHAALSWQMTGLDLDAAAVLRQCVNNLLADDLEVLDGMIPGGAE